MVEKCYGVKKVLYLVKFKKPDRIELHIHHDNQHTRKILENAKGDPRVLLKRCAAFSRSNTSAEDSLAEAMKDYWNFFERNTVDFIFH